MIRLITFSLLLFSQYMYGAESYKALSEDQVVKIACSEDTPIREHMRTMNQLITDLYDMTDEIMDPNQPDKGVAVKQVVMDRAQELRAHLLAVLPKTPSKLHSIDPQSAYRSKLIFQHYLARVIDKTIKIELEIMNTPTNPMELKNQRVRLQGLLVDVDSIIKEGHKKYRN